MKYAFSIKAQINLIKEKLSTNETWAKRALLRIYSAQTADEQNSSNVIHANGVGFTPTDTEFLSSLARQLIKYDRLSPKQMNCLYKKMPKYAGQLFNASYFDHAKMERIMAEAI